MTVHMSLLQYLYSCFKFATYCGSLRLMWILWWWCRSWVDSLCSCSVQGCSGKCSHHTMYIYWTSFHQSRFPQHKVLRKWRGKNYPTFSILKRNKIIATSDNTKNESLKTHVLFCIVWLKMCSSYRYFVYFDTMAFVLNISMYRKANSLSLSHTNMHMHTHPPKKTTTNRQTNTYIHWYSDRQTDRQAGRQTKIPSW